MAFKVGDRLVYPNHGVGVVERIQESLLDGSPSPCYQLRLMANNSRVMVPVRNSDRIGPRPLTRRAEVGRSMRWSISVASIEERRNRTDGTATMRASRRRPKPRGGW